jgi:hypothetical protein
MPVQHLKLPNAQIVEELNFKKAISDRERWEEELNRSKSTGAKFQKFYTETKLYYTNWKIGSDCNEILFINSGSVNVRVNDVLLVPNTSLRITGNAGEIDTTQYIVGFPTPNDPNNQITVLRKLYI